MKTTILAFLIGAVSGIIASLCGVGGGVILVPAFSGLLALTQKQAVATSLAVIIPTALIATLKNSTGNQPLIDWRIVLPAALGAGILAFVATDWMKSLSNTALTRIFAILMITVGIKLLFFSKA